MKPAQTYNGSGCESAGDMLSPQPTDRDRDSKSHPPPFNLFQSIPSTHK